MNDQAAGADWRKRGEALRHPVAVRDELDTERISPCLPRRKHDQLAQADLVGWAAEMNRHLPASIIPLERGANGILGIEAFAEISGKPSGGGLVAGKSY